MAHPPTVESVERAWDAHPDAKGLLHIGPTDYGVASDLAAVVQACHRRGKPIIVDEAWGAHLPFHDDLPTWGMDADADVVVTSVHKAGSAFEQSSVFHLKGDRVDPVLLKQREDLLSTTSTSSLMYGAIDGWRRQMVEQGQASSTARSSTRRPLRDGINGHRGAARGHRRGAARAPRRARGRPVPRAHRGARARDHRIPGRRLAARRTTGSASASSDHRRIEALITHGDDDATIAAPPRRPRGPRPARRRTRPVARGCGSPARSTSTSRR